MALRVTPEIDFSTFPESDLRVIDPATGTPIPIADEVRQDYEETLSLLSEEERARADAERARIAEEQARQAAEERAALEVQARLTAEEELRALKAELARLRGSGASGQ